MITKKISFTLAALVAHTLVSSAFADEGSSFMENMNFLAFRGSFFSAFQSSGNSYSGELSWNPSYSINEDWGAIAHVGFSLFKFQVTGGANLVTDFQLLGQFKKLAPMVIEAGVGMQNWHLTPTIATAAEYSVNLGYRPESKILSFIDQFTVGYSGAFFARYTGEIRAGVQITFK